MNITTETTRPAELAEIKGLKAPLSWQPIARGTIPNYSQASELLEEYYPYPSLSRESFDQTMLNIIIHIELLRKHFPDLRDLKGKHFLDLVCGARECGNNYNGKTLSPVYDPWLARLCHKFGAKVTGIDICPQQDEKFESHVLDLTDLDALSFLESDSFDAAIIAGFSSVTVVNACIDKNICWSDLKENINSHIYRCLKPGGAIIQHLDETDDSYVQGVYRRLLPN